MAKDTVTLRLLGEIQLPQFAEALQSLNGLLKALSDEVVGTNDIEWEITQLETGSAITEIRGVRSEEMSIAKVVRAYGIVGESMQLGRVIPYSDEVTRHALAIAGLMNGHIRAVEFVTDEQTSYIDKPIARELYEAQKQYSIGTITGTIHTISDRPRLRLGLTDPLFDRIVHCYIDDSQEALARTLWRRTVSVTGMIFRDPDSDRPLEVRRVRSIELVESEQTHTYKQAIGALPWQEGDEPAEVTIRRIRDAI